MASVTLWVRDLCGLWSPVKAVGEIPCSLLDKFIPLASNNLSMCISWVLHLTHTMGSTKDVCSIISAEIWSNQLRDKLQCPLNSMGQYYHDSFTS